MLNFRVILPLAMFTLPLLVSGTGEFMCPKGQVRYDRSVVAKFDDLKGAPAVPDATPIKIYDGLFYQAFFLAQTLSSTGVNPVVVPHSPPNSAATEVIGETTNGTPMLTTNYPNSNVTQFTPQSFYFGCTLDLANSDADPPQACSVTLTGYKGNDNTVAASNMVCAQTFIFNPTTITGQQQMAFSGAIKHACTNITHATFAFVPVGGLAGTSSALALIIDNVKYQYAGCRRKRA